MLPGHVTEDSITFYSYPKLLYSFNVVWIGVLFWLVDETELVSNRSLAVMYNVIIMHAFLTMGLEIPRNTAGTILLGVIALVTSISLADALFFSKFFSWMEGNPFSYSRGSGWYLMAVPWGIILLLMRVWAQFDAKWVITHNDVERSALFREKFHRPRPNLSIRMVYPDMLELFFFPFFTGDMEFYEGDKLIAKAENIPFLWFMDGKVDRFLESIVVSVKKK